MKAIRSVLSFILALIITLTTFQLPVYATNNTSGSGATGDNGEGNVTGGTLQSYPGTGWSDIRQGYRFYIINSNCQRVSDV